MAGRKARVGFMESCPFYGGPLHSERMTIQDVRLGWRLWERFGPSVQEGLPTYHQYHFDEGRQVMVYVGTVYGWDDNRRLRKD